MELQNYQQKDRKIRDAFEALKAEHPEKLRDRLNLSWSNWGFGIEPLSVSAERLSKAGVEYIELHGNHYGADLGYRPAETKRVLEGCGLRTAGVCGMFSAENDLSSNSGASRQRAVDYLRREIDFCAEMGGGYILVVPGAVGRPSPYDDSEMHRSAQTLRLVAEAFAERGIRSAVEPIRSAEVSFCHTVADALQYIEMVGHPAVAHLNGDVYHMQTEEAHVGEAILAAGERLTNLHLADSNRCALGEGSLDVDTMIMALYLIGYNRPGCYVTPEPLGPGGDPYPAMHGRAAPETLDALVQTTVSTFRRREDILREGL
jgi:sugar phosphate isomerase/epimerase